MPKKNVTCCLNVYIGPMAKRFESWNSLWKLEKKVYRANALCIPQIQVAKQ